MSQLAFFFDSSSCSGCKACQVACKDKHNLEVGRLWRRVYEVSGGEWRREGAAWLPDVYAYNLSIACNHCERPACLEACPAAAIIKRPDGIVLIDPQRCLGCGYCAWACPYGAMQLDRQQGVMTKCTLCYDELEQGRSPACVAACPLRSLEVGEVTALAAHPGDRRELFPLPPASLTQPGLVLRPHPGAQRAAQAASKPNGRAAGPQVRLNEERPPSDGRETPLVAFTLLAQAAAGMWLILALLGWWAAAQAGPAAAQAWIGPALPVAAALALSGLAFSLLHLKHPGRAWRAAANWRTSALSREVLLAGVFSAGSVLVTLAAWRSLPPAWMLAGELAVGLLGLGLVSSMAQVYRLPAVSSWNRPTTVLGFFASAGLLGSLGALLALPRALQGSWRGPLAGGLQLLAVCVALFAAARLALALRRPGTGPDARLAPVLYLWGVALVLVALFSDGATAILLLPAAALLLAAEWLVRLGFYRLRRPRF